MNSSERRRLERLVSSLCDEGATRERLTELEALLLDRPDLQDEYARLMRVDFMLSHEFKLSRVTSNENKRSLHGVLSAEDGAAYQVGARHANEVSVTTGVGCPKRGALLATQATRIAATLLFATAASVALWFVAQSSERRIDLRHADLQVAFGEDGIVIRDFEVLSRLEQLNRTKQLASVTLPLLTACDAAESSAKNLVTLCSGAAWMDYSPDHRERGYLLSLPPGVRMDVLIDANASCHNSLSVVELKDAGRMTGRTLSFTNQVEGATKSLEYFADTIGEFSELNDGSDKRFYLITGTHKLIDENDKAHWRASDFRVHFEQSDTLVLGWDDSGYRGEGPSAVADPPAGAESTIASKADRDFDDMRAVFRFSGPGIHPPQRDLSFAPQPQAESASAELRDKAFFLDVRPGEEALLLLSSHASLNNQLQVIDAETRQLIWRHHSADSHLVSAGQQTVYLIRNHGETVQRFALQGKFQSGDDHPWEESQYRIVTDSQRTTILGFEDNVLGEKDPDWNDIRVDIHRFASESN